ncbi:hypothetical protein ACVWZ6_002541 [Bradyrhizobium sp. GM6.1]
MSSIAIKGKAESSRPWPTPWAWLLLPGSIFLVVLFVVPLTGLLLLAFGLPSWTLANFVRIADTPLYLTVMRNTLEISVIVTALTFVLSYPIAYALTTAGVALRTFLLIAVVLPYFTSTLARTFRLDRPSWAQRRRQSVPARDWLGLPTSPDALQPIWRDPRTDPRSHADDDPADVHGHVQH